MVDRTRPWLRVVPWLVITVLLGIGALRVESNRNAATVRQDRVIRQLCDRGHIIDGLVQAAIIFAQQPPELPGAEAFIREFTTYHLELIDQLTNEDSPCVIQ
jgi:hypothetical protein